MVDENGDNKNGPTDLDLKIIRQVEYYFGDFNLRKDKFLKEASEKNDGWILLETLTTFNRLKTLATDTTLVANALRKSPNKLLEVHEDGSKVRRNVDMPLPQDDDKRREDIVSRSVYVKGFPTTLNLDSLLEYFKENTTDVEHVQMLYRDKKAFKGSVFVVFTEVEKAKEFVSKEEVKYEDIVLHRETKSDYRTRKQSEWAAKKEERKKQKKDGKDDGKPVVTTETIEIEKGCVIHLKDLPEDLRREDLKELFQKHGTVAWVDFDKGDKEAWIRFQEPNQAIQLQSKISTDGLELTLKDKKLETRVLEGNEETEFWKKLAKSKQERKLQKHKGKRGKTGWGRRGGKGNFRDRGTKREAEDESNVDSSAKRMKEETT